MSNAAKVTGTARVMLAMAVNAEGGEVFVALAKEKRAVAKLEALGLVTVRRTEVRFAGLKEWYFRAVDSKAVAS